jgi:Na+/H+ antiporter NhaD/arsenite permease-like protein
MISIYIVLSFELIHRTAIALLASVIALHVVVPQESLDFIIELIDFNTVGLLLGMMIIVAILGETGVFNWFAVKVVLICNNCQWSASLLKGSSGFIKCPNAAGSPLNLYLLEIVNHIMWP